MSIVKRIFAKEELSRYLADDQKFSKTMTAKDLIALGIGTVIGTGIFILPGTIAATKAGPGIILSFILAAIVCSLTAMCYAEFSSALPVAGSAFSFGNVVYGEIIGWILGWALILEYMLAVAAVAVSWAAYFNALLAGFGIHVPTAISSYFNPAGGSYVNLVAVLIVLAVSALLHRGLSTSMRFNNIMVGVKIFVILFFVIVGAFFVKPSNWNPFLPFGTNGIVSGAATVFFAYLGFDVVSASAAEVKNPRKTMPIGIIGTLLVCTVLYVLVAVVLTGMASYTKLNVANPVAYAFQLLNQNWIAGIITLGSLAGMTTMLISVIHSSSRLVYSIGRDGLLPKALSTIDPTTRIPKTALTVVTLIIVVFSGFISLDELTSLVNFGTLLAFVFVSFGIILLRRRDDIDQTDGFKVPFYPVLPIVSALASLYLMTQLSVTTYTAAAVWFLLGLILYFTYGIRHSAIKKQ